MNDSVCCEHPAAPDAVCDLIRVRQPAGSVLLVGGGCEQLINLSTRLHQAGFRVSVAQDVRAGVEAALYHAPDVVVLDLDMPGHGGLGILRVLRSVPTAAETPVVALASENNPAAERVASCDMVARLMVKPVTGAALTRVVAALCERRRDPVREPAAQQQG
ncbi:MAG: response regulator [Planctomycetes bacterium]|nr:response regulator [Planctomycetota bacterium]